MFIEIKPFCVLLWMLIFFQIFRNSFSLFEVQIFAFHQPKINLRGFEKLLSSDFKAIIELTWSEYNLEKRHLI